MPAKPARKKSRYRWVLGVLIVLATCVLLFVGLVLLVRGGVFGELPTITELAAIRNEEATLVLAADSTIIGKVFAEDRTNIRYRDLPQALIDALVSTEDQRFFTHSGVDALSYVRVLFRTIFSGDRSGGGGSTISQQIVKNLYGRGRHGLLTIPVNKIKEAIVASRLEHVYSKEEVLTLYFNSVPFGENIFGVEAAARRFFSTNTAGLRTEEGAVLVGMLKANTTYNPRLHPTNAKQRRDQVLRLMRDHGKLTSTATDSLQHLPLRIHYSGADALDLYGYFVQQVTDEARTILAHEGKKSGKARSIEKDGLRVYTTLDPALQHAGMEAMRTQLAKMQPLLDRELRQRKVRQAWEKKIGRKADRAWKKNERAVRDVFEWTEQKADTLSYRDSLWHYQRMLNGAVLMMEPRTGAVRAWIGGNDHRYLPYDLVKSRRSIASTVKPMLYAAALESGLDPCTYLENEEKDFPDYDGWHPRNFDNDSGGRVAMWYALAHSMNLPTVDLYFKTGEEAIDNVFEALGIPQQDLSRPAIALGAVDASLRDMVRAYGAFANQGAVVRPRMIERITDASGKLIYRAPRSTTEHALEPYTAARITTMLERAVNEGTGSSLRSRFGIRSALAGKTGTSQDFTDAWFLGYTPGLVIGTWVGAFDPDIHFTSSNGTGAQLALPIVGGVLAEVERSPELRTRYIRPFTWPGDFDLTMDCEPTKSADPVGEFLQDVFGREKEKDHVRRPLPDSARSRHDRKPGFLERLFRKKH